ncbi:MAG: DUF2383 domain-containing protein [Candidatus Nucleicultricaceae bacterium]
MVTLVGQQDNIIEAVQSLIELDYDAIQAYEAAINRLENENYKRAMSEFKTDHERHIKELGEYLRSNHEEVPHESDFKGLLAQGKVIIAGLVNDNAILKAMKSNEEDTNTAYERMCNHAGLTSALKDILKRGLEDERNHYNWIEKTLNAGK